MLWKGRRESGNVIDIENQTSGRRMGGRPGVGLGTALFLGVAIYLMGGDPTIVLNMLGDPTYESASSRESINDPAHTETKQLVGVVLASLEDTWKKVLRGEGLAYKEPHLVLFRDGVDTSCGYGQSITGPFYCPADEKVYLDLSFLDDLKRMGASGDFALAYVIAHEIGHHVQNIIGAEREFRERQGRVGQSQAKELQVAMELQADCFAGIWAHYANQETNFIEHGDIEEGINAASAVGDDHLQQMAGQRVTPDSFTHGSSRDRVKAFLEGLKNGNMGSCRK